jgi:Na+/H+-dicarboxylate symporter
MNLGSNLPAILPAMITFIVVSVLAVFALAWNKQPQIQELVRRTWLFVSVLALVGVAVFWISTTMVQPGATVDHRLQEQQQRELQQRLQNGGH